MLKLRLLTGPRAGRQLRVSDTKPVSVGRRTGRLRLHDSRVSKRHAKIFFGGGVWVLRDLGSANGTYVNRKKCDGLFELETGDVLQMGRVLIKVLQADAVGMDPMRGLPGAGSSRVGIDAFTASGTAGKPPAIEMVEVEQPKKKPDQKPTLDDELDLSSLDDADAERDLLDFSDMSHANASHAGSELDATQVNDKTLAMDLQDADKAEPEPDVPELEPELLQEAAEPESGSTSGYKPADVICDKPLLEEQEADAEPADTDEPAAADETALPEEPEAQPAPDAEAETEAEPEVEAEIEVEEIEPAFEIESSDGSSMHPAMTDEDDASPEVVGLHLDQRAPHQPAEQDEEDEVISERDDPAEASDAGLDAALQTPEQEAEDVEVQAEVEAEAEPEPETVAQTPSDTADELEQKQDEAPAFDIDAAFDALSEGLDDALPGAAAIDELPDEKPVAAESDEQAEDQAEDQPEAKPEAADLSEQGQPAAEQTPAAEDASPADMAGSQLDISFIRDALAKLGEQTDESPAEAPGDDDAPARFSEQRAALDRAQAEAEDIAGDDGGDDSVDQLAQQQVTTQSHAAAPPLSVPPGLNPTSMLPPSEPPRSYRPPAPPKIRWFTSLLILIILGLSGTLAYVMFIQEDKGITGRPDTRSTAPADTENQAAANNPQQGDEQSAQGTDDTPSTVPEDDTAQTPEGETTDPVEPAVESNPPSQDDPQDTGAQNAAAAAVPDPFGAGPAVIGEEAVQGITVEENEGASVPDPIVIVPPAINVPEQDPGDPAGEIADQPKQSGRIVFLVDASGSLVDSLPQMLIWLNKAIQTIGPEERFTVIYFKTDQAIEPEPAGLIAPKPDRLAEFKQDWLDPDAAPVLPTGRSDPAKAIAQALTYNPTDIYFLSDESFARYAGDTTRDEAVKLVTDAMGKTKGVRLHGVQFFYRDEGGVLETLTQQYDGTFDFIEEDVVLEPDPIDLLEELEQESKDEQGS